MRQAPTSGVHGTAGADIAANAASFARHLRAQPTRHRPLSTPTPMLLLGLMFTSRPTTLAPVAGRLRRVARIPAAARFPRR
jgi:hypothetical protein